jgi:hypothetical protein
MDQDQKSVSNAIDSTASSVDESEAKEVVAYATHRKLLDQRKRTQQENEELRSKLEAYEAQQKEVEENTLKAQGEYKKIAEAKEREANELKAKYKNLETTVINDYKTRAFEKALPGKIRNEKYLNFVDLNSIVINPESGQIDEDSLKVTVGEFMKEHGESLVARQAGAKLPSASAPASGFSFEKPITSMTRAEQMEALKSSVAGIVPTLLKKNN